MISYLSDMDGVLIKEGEMIPGADKFIQALKDCLLYTSPSPRDQRGSRMPSSA